MVHTTTSAYCSPEQDPFLLLESSLRCIEHILRCHVNQPLRRSWIEHPYGEEEIALLEEEMLPVLQRCLQRIDEIDAELEEELELLGAAGASLYRVIAARLNYFAQD